MAGFVRVPDIESVRREWIELLPSCSLDTVFTTPEWQDLWHRTLGRNSELMLLRLENGDAHGLAPLVRNGATLNLMGGTDVCDYHELLAPRGTEGTYYPALAASLAKESWKEFVLTSIMEGSPTLEHLRTAAASQGWSMDVEKEDVAPGVALPESWDDFLAALSKKDRHELRRKLRRLEGTVAFRAYLAPITEESLTRDLDDFLRLMRASDPQKDSFLTPERESFFRQMAAEMVRLDYFRLFFMEVDSKRVAAAVCFDYKGQRLLYNSGLDLAYSPLSVGLLLKALCIKDAIERKMTYYDFLRGNEPYKYDLGAKDRTLFKVTVRRP